MRAADRAVQLLRERAGTWYYTNDAWPREHPVESGGTDCSGAVQWAYRQCGIEVGGWTGAQSSAGREVARGSYPYEIPWSDLAPGDLILMTANHPGTTSFAYYDCHVELYCGGGTMIGHPGGYGPQEKRAQAWMEAYGCTTWMVRRVDGEVETPEPSDGVPEIRFCAWTDTSGGFLPVMEGRRDTGGSADTFAGDGGRFLYVAMDFPGWYQACTEANGWLETVSRFDPSDLVNGCAGDGSPITAVRCYFETPNPGANGWHAIEYSVNELASMHDLIDQGGSADDFAGNGEYVRKLYARTIKL